MGNYQIGPRIGSGGMAEVYLGTHQAIGGFRKLVVMKRLLGWRVDDADAVEGLLDEARIAATINHPNVVTTLDIGLERGSPYIVLEYLSGEDLLYVLHELHARKANVPLGVACRIGASIAAALAQAHDIMLPDGTHRCIVHRDVTPSNIIACYGGATKLVDFGVARVINDDPKTKTGMVKGKFSYLAPEQLTGAPLDGRTDVFQLGIVMWEMTTMSRLFDGRTDHERVNAVLNRAIQDPSKLNPAVPPCLDRTIMRALSRDPDARHQNASELESDLLGSLGALGGSGGEHSVGKWMQIAFPERFRWRLELERRTLAEAEKPGNGEDEEIEITVDSEARDNRGSPWSRRSLPTSRERATAKTASSLRGIAIEKPAEPPPSPPRGRKLVLASAAAGAVIAAAVWTWRSQRDSGASARPPAGDERAAAATTALEPAAPDAPTPYEIDIRVTPTHATIAVDGEVLATGRVTASYPDDGTIHTVTLSAPGHATVIRRLRGPATLDIGLVADAPAGDPIAAPVSANEARGAKSADRNRRRRRSDDAPAGSATPSVASGSEDAAPPPVAPAPAPPVTPTAKPADESFAPKSDNLDPFKTGS
jgi:serine/threonine-protein kinase